MMWAGICLGARIWKGYLCELVEVNGENMTADRYIKDILEDHVVPFIGDSFTLMQDNARAHSNTT